ADVDIDVGGDVDIRPVAVPDLSAWRQYSRFYGSQEYNVNPGTETTLEPGHYAQFTANGGVVRFTGGVYYFKSLTINSGVDVHVPPIDGATIIVRDNLTLRGRHVEPASWNETNPRFHGNMRF